MVIYVVLVLTPNYEILKGRNYEYVILIIAHHLLRSKKYILREYIYFKFREWTKNSYDSSAYMCCHSAPTVDKHRYSLSLYIILLRLMMSTGLVVK